MQTSPPAQGTEPIYFYLPKEPNGFLCNFYPSPFVLEGKHYPTVQHYFQSQKFVGAPEQALIISAEKPREAFERAKQWKGQRRTDWDSVNDDVMYIGFGCKFRLHADLRQMLLGTGSRELIEHTTNDSYWADGGNGTGQNKLGRLLMKLRKQIQEGIEK